MPTVFQLLPISEPVELLPEIYEPRPTRPLSASRLVPRSNGTKAIFN